MDIIDQHECYDLTREGRFLIARLQTPHQVANDPEGGRPEDMRRMCVFVVATCLLSVGLAAVYLIYAGF